MTPLRFHKDLYSPQAIDAAIAAFASFASFNRCEQPEHLVVNLSCTQPDDESVVAGEFSNYVLGATVDRVKPEGPKP